MSNTIDQEFVQYIVNALVSQPDQVRVDRTVDERGVLLTLYVAEADLGRVIGRKGSTAQSLRVLLRALGSKNEAHYNLRIVDDHSQGPRSSKTTADGQSFKKVLSDDQEDSSPAGLAPEPAVATESPAAEEPPAASPDSLADKTKRELSELNDLDI